MNEAKTQASSEVVAVALPASAFAVCLKAFTENTLKYHLKSVEVS